MSTRDKLLRLLDDQHCQSGSDLGKRLGVSRAAVQQHIAALRAHDVPIVAVPRQGYRLQPGVSLLSEQAIRTHLPERAHGLLTDLRVVTRVDSTNDELLRRKRPIHGAVLLAEDQFAGRGRRGKTWQATPYRNVMLSVGWVFPEWPAAVSALGLVAALAVIRALATCAVPDVGVKWPNDLLWRRRKLGGLLLDLAGEAGGTCQAVVGVGVNVALDPAASAAIEQPWTDLTTIADPPPQRNLLAAAIVDELLRALDSFPGDGFTAVAEEWRRKHVLQDQQVEVVTEQGSIVAKVIGVDDAGALMVREPSGVAHRFFHGEVSVRGWQ